MAVSANRDFGADWVINSDADEFWRALYGEFEKNDGLQQYCSQNAYDLARIQRELASGEIIEDRRLTDYLYPLMTRTQNE